MNPAWFGFSILALYAFGYAVEAWRCRDNSAEAAMCAGGCALGLVGAASVVWGIW